MNSTTQSSPRPIWTRDFSLLFVANLAMWTAIQVYAPVMPLYLTWRMGASLSQIGLMATAATSLDVVARLFFGFAMVRWGRRSLMLGSLALWAVVAFLYGVPTSLLMLSILRIAHAVPMAGSSSALLTVASELVPDERRGEGLSFYSLGTTLAIVIGPALALAVLGEDRYQYVFWTAGLLGMAAMLLCSAIRFTDTRSPNVSFSVRALVERRMAWLSLATLLIYMAFSSQSSFVALYSVELNIAPTSWYFAIYGVSTIASRAITGRLFDQHGPGPAAGTAIALLGSGLLLLGVCSNAVGYLGAAVLVGLGFGIYAPVVYAMASNVVPAERRGAANAMAVSSMALGFGVGASVYGLIGEAFGYRVMYVAAGLSTILPIIAFFVKVIPHYAQNAADQQVAVSLGGHEG